MRKNIAKVIDAFLHGRSARGDSKNTCSTDGTILYSYLTPIAVRVDVNTVVVMDRYPTATTTSQLRALKRELPKHDIKLIEVSGDVVSKSEGMAYEKAQEIIRERILHAAKTRYSKDNPPPVKRRRRLIEID